MSKHDPKVTLLQITDYAHRAQELCAQNELPQILTDWQKRFAFERTMEVLGEAVKRLPVELTAAIRQWIGGASPGCATASATATMRLITICSGRRFKSACPACSPPSGKCSRIWKKAR